MAPLWASTRTVVTSSAVVTVTTKVLTLLPKSRTTSTWAVVRSRVASAALAAWESDRELSTDMTVLQESAALLSVAADPVRLGILNRLATAGTRCVCDLQPADPVPPNVLSYHLKVLREAGLVTTAKRGRWVDYTLADDALDRLYAALPVPASVPQGGARACR